MAIFETITVNISSSFFKRAKCKDCGGGPNYYYPLRKPVLWDDPRQLLAASKWLRTFIKRLVEDWYLDATPKYFTEANEFSYSPSDKHFTPTRFRTRGLPTKQEDNVIDVMVCECGASVWWYNQKSVKNKPEIVNRKGKYGYPDRFEW
jgi:hypothetical protein